ncbi:MAG: thiopurine S-methyltransferase [Thiohalobacteraceae bacterium]
MEPSFWHARWEANEIGFHQDEINAHLQRYWSRFELPPGGTVFVPLCGKTRDMLWLASQGLRVVGVEISPIATAAFFNENGLSAEVAREGRFVRHTAAEVRLLEGDYFDLAPADLGPIDAVYDRASLIALPPDLRRRYVDQMARLTAPGVPLLLITLAYPQQEMQGPPFAVTATEVEELWSPGFRIEPLDDRDILEENPRFRARGLTLLQEQLYRLTRR